MGDTVFINSRAAVHKGSAGQSMAFPDVCLCPPTPPTGPVPTPLPNTVVAADLMGGAATVRIEGNPAGKQTSFFMKSTGNEMSLPTGGGVVSHATIGKAYFQSFAANVFFEAEPAVRHLDLLTHNHLAPQPGNTPPVPWLSVQSLPPMPAPPLRIRPIDVQPAERKTPKAKLNVRQTGLPVADDSAVIVTTLSDGSSETKTVSKGKLELSLPKGSVRIAFKELREAFWARKRGFVAEPVDLGVTAAGYPDGTPGQIQVYEHTGDELGACVAELKISLNENLGRASWTFEPKVGKRPVGLFVFIATVDNQQAWSDVALFVPRPVSDLRGAKAFLRALGYDAGAIDLNESASLERAIRAFQIDHEMDETGQADATTQNVLRVAFEHLEVP